MSNRPVQELVNESAEVGEVHWGSDKGIQGEQATVKIG